MFKSTCVFAERDHMIRHETNLEEIADFLITQTHTCTCTHTHTHTRTRTRTHRIRKKMRGIGSNQKNKTKISEKELSEKQICNLPDKELKVIVINKSLILGEKWMNTVQTSTEREKA